MMPACASPFSVKALQRAFTLLELLVVITILGIMAAVIAPNIAAGLQGTKVSIAARNCVQAVRYARTMALLHQTETEVFFDESGTAEVRAKVSSYVANAFADIREAAEAEADFGVDESERDDGLGTNQVAEVVAAKSFADEINSKFVSDNVGFSFLGYTDSIDKISSGDDETNSFAVVFRSNGTCRPFRLRVTSKDNDDDFMTVSVDMLGVGKIEEYGEDAR